MCPNFALPDDECREQQFQSSPVLLAKANRRRTYAPSDYDDPIGERQPQRGCDSVTQMSARYTFGNNSEDLNGPTLLEVLPEQVMRNAFRRELEMLERLL
jgi:hypothetical protein